MCPGVKFQEVVLGKEVEFIKREIVETLKELELFGDFPFIVIDGVGSFSSAQFFLC